MNMTRFENVLRAWVATAVVVLLGLGGAARAEPFFSAVDLGPLRSLTVQDNLALKTLDTYARQRLNLITGKTSLDGNAALPAILDMTFRPELYHDRNLVRIKSVPLRKDFEEFEKLSAEEKKRIVEEGTVSLAFLMREDTQAFLENVRGTATFKEAAVSDLMNAGMGLMDLFNTGMLPAAPIPPRAAGDRAWKSSAAMVPLSPKHRQILERNNLPHQHTPAGYDGQEKLIEEVLTAQESLRTGWREQSPANVNAAVARLADLLPRISPDVYPAEIKRTAEVVYNQAFKLTIPTAFVYFAAFVLFLLSTYSGASSLRIWGLRLFTLAFVIHTAAILIRWWLVSKSVGNWFESIPIKNQFESVLFSSWFGAAVGLSLEIWRSKGIWGAAASFVGWLSLVAIFVAPFAAGREIGGEIGMSAGVLMSYWLYIHVTMAVAGYALIGMSFMLGTWWLIKRYFGKDTLASPPDPGGPSGGDFGGAGGSGGRVAVMARAEAADFPGGAVALSPAQTLAALFLFRTPKAPAMPARSERRGPTLEMLDACNLVILQLAFWVLGVAIILGAVWADQSWGRPWGWDPKETFALVTWIVYLAIVHIRMATKQKAWWTAVLSIVGFAVMLFNWIGVNFFLVGLHSYA
jgi:cytochrome c-type biogenesis protein CcsB